MKVFFDTIGCRLNQAEIERMAAEFRACGHEVVGSAVDADLVIINTCTVTAAAASDSRSKTRQAYRAGAQQIILTGCWATVSPVEARELAGVSKVYSNERKNDIPREILGRDKPLFELELIERKPLPGIHRRTRAFIKVQDGCDNQCTFCITRIARGRSRSLPIEEIMLDIQRAVDGGTHEAVLSGVNLGAWGREFGKEDTLTRLIETILAGTNVERLRLSSIEPWDIDADLLRLWQNPRMCRHMHIPLQSGSGATLKRMARRITPDQYRELIQQVRMEVPKMAITTDIIVGFAGETDDEFEESLAFVGEMNFAGGHVFRYSPREGTPAALLHGRINGRIAQARSEKMRDVLCRSEIEYHQQFLGCRIGVLWESSEQISDGNWQLHGLTDNYLSVTAIHAEDRWNWIDEVELRGIEGNWLLGNITE